MGQERTPREIALKLLARREHSRQELRAKLCARGVPVQEAESVLEALAAGGLQSDARYAEAYVRSRAAQAYGPQRIRLELKQRGVAEEYIEQALDACDEDWTERARRYYRRRFGARPPADFRERSKRLRHMQQRGFDVDTLRASLDDDAAAQEG